MLAAGTDRFPPGDQRFVRIRRFFDSALEAARFFRHDVVRTPEGLIAYHSDSERGRTWADALFMVTPLIAKAGRLLDPLPAAFPGRDGLFALYQDFARSIADHQGGGRMWHQLLDRPDSYEETSCTGVLIYALARGVQRGWLDESYAAVIERGYEGLSRMISLNGAIDKICTGTPTQSSEEAYLNWDPRRNDSHGIDPVLLTLHGVMGVRSTTE